MMEIQYAGFSADCENTFGRFLNQFGFNKQSEDAYEFEVVYESDFWRIVISMLSNFPHVGVAFDFRSREDKTVRPDVLDKALAVDEKKNQSLYEKYFTREHFDKSATERYKIQMEYCVEMLAEFYRPLLTGDFTFEDYEKLASQG